MQGGWGRGGPQKKGNSLTRSNSVNFTSNGAPKQAGPSPKSRTTDDLPRDAGSEGEDIWGDDVDDSFWFQATQGTEQAEFENQSPVIDPGGNRNSTINPSDTLQFRRKLLEESELESGMGGSVVGGFQCPVTSTSSSSGGQGTLVQEIERLRSQVQILQREKSQIMDEKNRYCGEADILRKRNEQLLKDSVHKLQDRFRQGLSAKDPMNDMNFLQTEVKRLTKVLAEKSIDKMEEYSKMVRQSPRTRKSKENGRVGDTSGDSSMLDTSSSSASLCVQDVNANVSLNHFVSMENVSVPPTRNAGLASKHVQTEQLPEVAVASTSSNASEANPELAKSKPLLDQYVDLDVMIRGVIFDRIDDIIEYQYRLITPKLQRVSKVAPTQIMAKLVGKCETKTAFPEVVDTMFHWSLEQERRKVRMEMGIANPNIPRLPTGFSSDLPYMKILDGIRANFLKYGVREALNDVKDRLEKLLKSLEGRNTCKLYQYDTLTNFWKLLLWGFELWRCILHEEQNEGLMWKVGKKQKKALEDWTGLALKSDWRNYFVLELEQEVRCWTLGILEMIVLAGYFEQKSNRYEILYRVIKDVLMQDTFRNHRNVRRVLSIVTKSLSDRMIFKHLCYKNNEPDTCLARIIGDSAQITCHDISTCDPEAAAILFRELVLLVITLAKTDSENLHLSRIAHKDNSATADCTLPNTQLLNNSEAMDFDQDFVAASQFACPMKYNATVESMEVDEVAESKTVPEDEHRRWIHPSRYEDPYQTLKRCQCRKVLTGSAVFAFRTILDVWREMYQLCETTVEDNIALNEEELGRLKYMISEKEPVATLQRKSLMMLKQKRLSATDQAISFYETKCTPESDWNQIHNESLSIFGEKEEFSPENIDVFQPKSNAVDLLDLAISDGLVLLNFLHNTPENLAAAIGSDAYKCLSKMIPVLRLHIDQLRLNAVERNILMSLSTECDEDFLGSAVPFAMSQEKPDINKFAPDVVSNPSAEYPCRLTPVKDLTMDLTDFEELSELPLADMSDAEPISDELKSESDRYHNEFFALQTFPSFQDSTSE